MFCGLQEHMPELYSHFQALGIATSMFASSWFLALYTTILPLPLACRVFDAFLSEVMLVNITGSAVALHCCKAHERINRKTGNSTHCKIVTPESFSSKVCTRDYVGDGNYCAIFCENRFSGGFSPNR